MHIGFVCPLCYQKGSELADGHPDKKYRARTVFLGNQVVDEYFQEAEMEGLGSAPPAMSDARAIQACALFPDYCHMISDADAAYLQTWLKALIDTWAVIPREFWPKEWIGKYVRAMLPPDPCPLRLHGFWGVLGSKKRTVKLRTLDGPTCLAAGVPSTNKVLTEIAFLMIYVDDFLMACHKKDVDKLWDPIRTRIRLAKPEPADRFLGCYTRRFEAPVTEFKDILSILPSQWTRLDENGEKRTAPIPWKPKDPKKVVQCFEYDMATYFEGVVDKYCMIKGIAREKLGTAPTPFVDESKDPSGVEHPDLSKASGSRGKRYPKLLLPFASLTFTKKLLTSKSWYSALWADLNPTKPYTKRVGGYLPYGRRR